MSDNNNSVTEAVKDWRLLEFFVPIEEKVEDDGFFVIKGVAINETTTLNNIKYIAEELAKAAPSFRNVPILLDHRNEVRNIVGRTTEQVHYNPNTRRIEFEGRIMDKGIQEMIKDGRIGSVSIGAKVEDLIKEEDGSQKAIGIQGMEISLVACPGDNHATLAQAIKNSFMLKEKAMLRDTQLNIEENQMAEDEIKSEETQEVEVEVKSEEAEVKSEEKEEVKSEESSDMQKQINELKTLITSSFSELKEVQKKVKEEVAVEEPKEEVAEDETKGEVSAEEDKTEESLSDMVVERAKVGYSMYRDYSKGSSDSNLKRLVR